VELSTSTKTFSAPNASVPDKSNSTNYDQIPGNFPQNSQWKMVSNAPIQLEDSKVLQIKPEELVLEQNIGSGSFGEVWRGKWRSSDAAIKQVKSDLMDDNGISEFWKEANLVGKLRPHNNIVLFFGVCLQPLCLVFEFLSNGNIRTYLDDKSKPVGNDLIMKWFKGIASGMLHLSLEGIIHRDLAARNVLLTATLDPKISDFGMSRQLQQTSSHVTKNAVGPLKWMAPESLVDNTFSEASDVWSFGVTIYEIVTRSDPYPELSPVQVATKVAHGEVGTYIGGNYMDATFINLINRCFAFKTQDRPKFLDIMRTADLTRSVLI